MLLSIWTGSSDAATPNSYHRHKRNDVPYRFGVDRKHEIRAQAYEEVNRAGMNDRMMAQDREVAVNDTLPREKLARRPFFRLMIDRIIDES